MLEQTFTLLSLRVGGNGELVHKIPWHSVVLFAVVNDFFVENCSLTVVSSSSIDLTEVLVVDEEVPLVIQNVELSELSEAFVINGDVHLSMKV